jgi:hypothetical protein
LVWSLISIGARGGLGRHLQRLSSFFVKFEPIRTGDVIPLLCFVLIVANYFYSSLAKISLDGGIFSWIVQNNIAYIYTVARDNQQLLWAELPYLPDWIYILLNSAKLPLAVTMLFFQLFAVFSFANRKWLIAAFIFLDLSHLGIFLLVGANFASWFALNIALIATARILPDSVYSVKNSVCSYFLFRASCLSLDWAGTTRLQTIKRSLKRLMKVECEREYLQLFSAYIPIPLGI